MLSHQALALGNPLQDQERGVTAGSSTLYTNSSIFSMAW